MRLITTTVGVALIVFGGVLTCAAQDPIPVTAVKVQAAEPGSLAEALKLIQATVNYNFKHKANTVTAVVMFYKNGQLTAERFYTDDKIRLPSDARSDLGSLTVSIIDLDKHPAVATKPGQQLLHLAQQLGGKSAAQAFVLPKATFDLTAKGRLRTYTEPSTQLYFWVKGDIRDNDEIKNEEDLLKKYPTSEIMVISIFSLG